MSNFTIPKDQKAFAFDASIPPVLEIDSGDTVTFETGDAAYERLSKGETVEAIGLENFNAVTGPVRVRGAEAGDALKIEINDIQVTRAWSVWLPDFGGLGKHTKEVGVKPILLKNERAYISNRLSVDIKPMIGCIGVAPAEGKGSTFMPAYPYGGNMDLREMSAGATLYLPVQVDGALLAMGDLHAAMGVAEPTWVSLEAAGSATLTISVEKNMKLKFPRLRIGSSTYCVGMGDTLEKAHQAALDEAYSLLINERGLEPFDAYAFASAVVDMRLGGPATAIVLAVVPDF
ncbi:MAG: acetamidase/formamidase family protein [Chloroflexi bacterium]|nr:acetamidase/formamidase family protein [Chloroflexota bacterium]MCC6891590.1 acetamidase/formamidase family protein [Anaerolineae bacterium]